jgi:RND family efflux transporter MFP subunit
MHATFDRILNVLCGKLALLLLVTGAVMLGVVVGGCGKSDSSVAAQSGKQRYHCPMHPTYVSNQPGDCPICNMKLVPIKDDQAHASSASAPTRQMAQADPQKTAHIKPGQFYCPMDLNVVSNAPGVCPECNMKLIEKKDVPADHTGHHSVATAAPVPGRVSISLSPEKRQMIGLALSTVEQRELTRTVRATAVVVHDETRYARIAPRFGGWVRKLEVNFTGAPVEKGQALFTVYSPELFTTENEYLIAWRGLQQLKAEALEEQRRAATNLLASARRRLELWEIGDDEIRALEQRGTASDEMLFRAPIAGHVVAKTAIEGKAFMAGESLYEVADLSHLWLDAWVFESDLPLMKVGLSGTVTFPYLGNKTFTAAVTFLYPHIDPQTRRGRVRLELESPEHLLRPDMWASVAIDVPLGEKVLIPASAVIDTGQRFVAFVDGQDGHLEPREVKVGFKTDDEYEVLAGVKPSEKVVTRALFLVDSESQLKAAIAGMGEAGGHDH